MGADYSSDPGESNAGPAAKTPCLDDKAAMSVCPGAGRNDAFPLKRSGQGIKR
jgi:hypothetical protein